MNKIQKGLIGTALSATLVATVGFGTYSSFNDSETTGSVNADALETATIDVGLYDAADNPVGSDNTFQLFKDEHGLDLLPGETWVAEPFFIKNDGTRAFDIGWMNSEFDFDSNLYDRANKGWGYSGDSATEVLEPFAVTVDYTFYDSEGNVTAEESVSDNLASNDLRQLLGKGQRGNRNPLDKHGTFLPDEKVKIEVSLGLDESAGNEYQAATMTSEFRVKVEQNNEIERELAEQE
ncbi:hypothetical protein K8O68_08085 [Salipaludibacillus sp. CUR1]|uniref:hypothetical protein n=1 Tax=Salipaludibacillus sp. CUR1 TaxID=2820003 RepID=UPI001E3849E9|nr:hypothetical protein [Salipaludibacillus sp. CUR1]MCE7792375.1 hypothetical protein [Salipaludibacillus sp. CUR1]